MREHGIVEVGRLGVDGVVEGEGGDVEEPHFDGLLTGTASSGVLLAIESFLQCVKQASLVQIITWGREVDGKSRSDWPIRSLQLPKGASRRGISVIVGSRIGFPALHLPLPRQQFLKDLSTCSKVF